MIIIFDWDTSYSSDHTSFQNMACRSFGAYIPTTVNLSLSQSAMEYNIATRFTFY